MEMRQIIWRRSRIGVDTLLITLAAFASRAIRGIDMRSLASSPSTSSSSSVTNLPAILHFSNPLITAFIFQLQIHSSVLVPANMDLQALSTIHIPHTMPCKYLKVLLAKFF